GSVGGLVPVLLRRNETLCRSFAVGTGLTRVHVEPPLPVRRITPPLPTIQPRVASWKKTSFSCLPSVDAVIAIQFAPPLVVRRMRPAEPTTTPIVGEANDTALSVYTVEFETCMFHVLPVSVVCRIVPRSPTAQPSLRVTNHTPRSVWMVFAAALWSTQP